METKRPPSPISWPKLGLINMMLFPLHLLSLGTWFSELTRVYVNSGVFGMSIILGGFFSVTCAVQTLNNQFIKMTLILIFGIAVPVLYVMAAQDVYSLGWENYDAPLASWLGPLTLIGLLEIMLYCLCCFATLLYGISRLFQRKPSER